MRSQIKIQEAAFSSRPDPFEEISLGDESRAAFASLGPLQRYPSAIELFKQSSQAQDLYLVEHGLVKMTRFNREGRELILGLRPPGWVLGVASVILRKPYPASAFTLTTCHLRRIPAQSFIDLLRRDPYISWYFHQLQSREIYNQIAHMEGLGFFSARQRNAQQCQRKRQTRRDAIELAA